MLYDVFISHASEDKNDVARPLATRLRKLGLRVWLDEFELTIGDSLRRSIDRGLSQSRFGVVILSPNFFEKDWPQQELNGLAAKEVDGLKVILPVWHNITQAQVSARSPMLSDRLAATTERGIEEVAAQIFRVAKPASPSPPPRQERPRPAEAEPPAVASAQSRPTGSDAAPSKHVNESDDTTTGEKVLGAVFGLIVLLGVIFGGRYVWRLVNSGDSTQPGVTGAHFLTPGESTLVMNSPSGGNRVGTFCCYVSDGLGQRYILSSTLVISGSTGDVVVPLRSEAASANDRQDKDNWVARLAHNITRPDYSADPRIVGGIARLREDVKVTDEVPGLGHIKGLAPQVEVGEVLRIRGPRVGPVEVRVRQINVDASNSLFRYLNKLPGMILVDDVVGDNDSGAPVLNKNNQLVGIVIGGGADVTIVAPIVPILERYNVALTQPDRP